MMKKILVILFSPFIINAQTAFISGTHDLCDNEEEVSIEIGFTGYPPFTFVYDINGVMKATITTTDNPYEIKTKLEGVYTLSYFTDLNNTGSVNGSAIVSLIESPKAAFRTNKDTMSIMHTTLKLEWGYTSSNVVSWQWDFGDGNYSSLANPFHVYKDSLGIYEISLIVTDYMNCRDTAVKKIWIIDESWMYIPNSFTPDYNGVNDKFCLECNSIRKNNFLFKVFNHQGELVFQSTNFEELSCRSDYGGWDGTYLSTKEKLSSGLYSYNLFFQEIEGWKNQKYGTINLIR